MEELIEKSKNGDEEAFTELVISIETVLYKVARTRLGNEEDIKEAVQETIIQSFKSIKKLKKNEFFKTWMIKILINNCNKVYKKNKKVNNVQYDDSILSETSYSMESVENNLDFFFIIQKLSYDERITLILYYSESFTTKEIAKLLGKSESAIKNRLSRARNKLKKEIEGGIYNESF
ncbi:MAG: sigma-70 family RNA polymerase sigma factor [Clostridia bacterium]|nr:sigma-70 family RNA polymerase sigma factor [Clostridia bacterium]